MKKRSLLFWGYFWRYGSIFLTIALSFLVGLILLNIESTKKYATLVFCLVFGGGFIATGLDYILAIVFKKPHILLMNQSASHQRMNPDDISWEDISKKDWIGVGSIFIALGAGLIVVAFIKYLPAL